MGAETEDDRKKSELFSLRCTNDASGKGDRSDGSGIPFRNKYVVNFMEVSVLMEGCCAPPLVRFFVYDF